MASILKGNIRITGKYLQTTAPWTKNAPHIGIDAVSSDLYIYAPLDGRVERKISKSCGNYIWFWVNGKHMFTMCHLSRWLVGNGATVKAGTRIGVMGATGQASGVHLHLVYYPKGNGVHANPSKWLKEDDIYKGKTAKQHYDEKVIWKTRYDNRGKVITKLEASVARLDKERQALKKQLSNQDKKITALTDKNTTLISDIAGLKTENAALTESLNGTKKVLDNTQKKLIDIERRLANCEAEKNYTWKELLLMLINKLKGTNGSSN